MHFLIRLLNSVQLKYGHGAAAELVLPLILCYGCTPIGFVSI